ncbi:unnamed protein product [Cylicostephanus goldi]|uniref:Uncharacterized protein n=1 Tax=Cylicostephanus goldi TaxID=71465 RepID=A0A3P6RD72_CYLGO|nr:unnamed protein product [Cylicostephanus goldi]
MDMHRKHFAQNNDISYKSESPTACKSRVIRSVAETAQETEHEVAETAKASEERVLVEKKSKKMKCTETEASCIPKSSFSEKSSSEESQANRKDMGSSVAEKIISFSQLIEEKTQQQFNSNSNLNVTNADPPSLHDGTIEIPRSSNPESENRVKRSDRIPKLVGKEDCSELKHAHGNGNPTEANSRESLSKSDEVQERSRAVVEDLKRRLANTQGSTRTVTQDDVVDIWDSFSSSSSLDDEHIYEEIDEMTEVFGTKTDENLSLHNKFSAVSKENTHHIEEEDLVKASEVTTASNHSLAQASSHEKEAVMSGEAAKSNRKLQEERRDAKGGKLKSAKKSNNAGVISKNKEKQSTSTSQQSDTSVDISSEDEESKNFCFVIGF